MRAKLAGQPDSIGINFEPKLAATTTNTQRRKSDLDLGE